MTWTPHQQAGYRHAFGGGGRAFGHYVAERYGYTMPQSYEQLLTRIAEEQCPAVNAWGESVEHIETTRLGFLLGWIDAAQSWAAIFAKSEYPGRRETRDKIAELLEAHRQARAAAKLDREEQTS